MRLAVGVLTVMIGTGNAAADQARVLTIDARNGAVDGARQHGRRDTVRVVVTNMNPFLFEYDIEGQVHAIDEPALADVRALLAPAAPSATPRVAASPAPVGGRAAVVTADPCQGQLAALYGQARALDEMVTTSQRQAAETKQALDNVAGDWTQARQALLEGGASTASALRAAAEKARDALATTVSVRPSEGRLEAIAERAEVLRIELRVLVEQVACATRDPRFVEDARRQVEETLGGFLPEARENRRAQHESLMQLHAFRAALARVLARPDAFETQREFGPYDEPTDVVFSVQRRPIGGAASALAQVKLNFGGRARFAYSTGPVVSTLDRDTFARVDGVLDGAARAFVGYKERASTRARFLALAHARFADLGNEASLFATIGRVLDTENELLVGLSLGLAENRFLVTVGAYRGPRDVLENGFTVGQALPAAFTAEVPVRKQFEWSLAAGVSVRVK